MGRRRVAHQRTRHHCEMTEEVCNPQRPWHLKREPSSATLFSFSMIGFGRSNVPMHEYVPVRAVGNFVLPWMSRQNFADQICGQVGRGGAISAQMKFVRKVKPETFSDQWHVRVYYHPAKWDVLSSLATTHRTRHFHFHAADWCIGAVC